MSTTNPSSPGTPPSEFLFHLRQSFKLALSFVLFYWLALTTNWDVPIYGALAIALISLDTTGATIEKGVMRFVGTTVGVFIGFLVLSLCCYDRWALMVAFSVYLSIVAYFMQGSRYKYAWFVAAFVPLVVWADNYPNFESAFYFGVFRYLETTVGILIYTIVDLVLWPQRAGTQLQAQGDRFWESVGELFQSKRNPPKDVSQLPTKVKANLNLLVSTLDSAYIDTLDVREKASQWENWRLHAGRFADALIDWQATATDSLETDFDLIGKRIERLTLLWKQASNVDFVSAREDASLLAPMELDSTIPSAVAQQLTALDVESGELLRVQRELLGWDTDECDRSFSTARVFWSPVWLGSGADGSSIVSATVVHCRIYVLDLDESTHRTQGAVLHCQLRPHPIADADESALGGNTDAAGYFFGRRPHLLASDAGAVDGYRIAYADLRLHVCVRLCWRSIASNQDGRLAHVLLDDRHQ